MQWLRVMLFSLISLTAANALATDPIFTPWNNNLAIRGYDPVAYFTDNKPVKGDKNFEYDWQGATWRFASTNNKDMFINNPEKYAPQYGGYCAYAVSQGYTASIDPSQFSVVDGKLYLNYSKNVQEKWLVNQAAFIKDADEIWPIILKDN